MSAPHGAAIAGRREISQASRTVAVIVACALFMQNLDGTVIATALPAMADAFGVPAVRMNVALTAYLLSLAVFIPASGWIADRYGARDVFRAAIGVFTVGSILCGRAETLGLLIAARIVQGVGGAMMLPVGRLLLLRTVAKSEIVSAMAWLTIPALLGPLLGPPLGGAIVTYVSWRWIFDINVPIGVLGIALAGRYIPDVREAARTPFDWWGLWLTGVALAAFMFGAETLGRGVVPPLATDGLLALSVLAGAAYWAYARRVAAPLLDFRLMRLPTFMVSVVAGSLFRIGVGAIPFLLPLMLQVGFGRSAVQSGATTFVAAVGALAMKPVANRLLRRAGFRAVLAWNGVLAAVTLMACAAFRPGWPIWALWAVLLAGGLFRSLQFTAFNAIAYAEVERERMSAATSLYSTLQQVSLTLGVTVGAAVLTASGAITGHATPGPADFTAAFLLVGGVSLLGAPFAWLLRKGAGSELTG